MNTKTKHLTLFSIFLVAVLLVISCKKDSTDDPNQALIAEMKAVTDSIIQNTQVPGIVALVVDHKRGIDWLYTAGLSDIPNNLPMKGDHTFRIASITKTMAVTVLLQLVDEGKIELNDKLSRYDPEFPKADSITIAMLCNMTSGIFNYSYDPDFIPSVLAAPSKVWLPQELVDIGCSHDFNFSPDTGWDYSNTNIIVLGQIIELLTGNTLESEINTRIIQPLNLSKSGFLTSGVALPGIHGRGYYRGYFEENADFTEYFDISQGWAAGAAYSTPRELQKYAEALVGGGFLSDSLQNRRLNDIILLEPNVGYGLGIIKMGSFYGHGGTFPGFTTLMFHSNEKGCTVIIYFNCWLELPPGHLFARFMDILFGNDF
jgi:D-alanyl-D-alanine carboxypeptidase